MKSIELPQQLEKKLLDEPLDQMKLVFIDLEMTGLNPKIDRIIEIAAIVIKGNEIESTFHSLVRPEPMSGGNEHIHGIFRYDLKCAPTFHDIIPTLVDLFHDSILVAHAAACDISFLESEFERSQYKIQLPYYIDTLTLSRRAFALKSHSLFNLCKSFNIQQVRPHRALDDVQALVQIWKQIIEVLLPKKPRDLMGIHIGKHQARPEVLATAQDSAEKGSEVTIHYRPSGKPIQEFCMQITNVRTDLDPPRILGYHIPSRGRRELRADRVIRIEPGNLQK